MYSSSPMVLCVDDDADDLQFITSIIKEVEPSLSTTTASDGEDALTVLKKAKQVGTLPVLILLDINMPRMNGKQALAHIKSDPVLQTIPVVVFTTSAQPADKLYCTHYGAEMVTKPDTVSKMKSVLQKLLYGALYC